MEKETKKVYILTQSVLNGTVTMNVYCSVFTTKELAEKTRDAVIEANEKNGDNSFQVLVGIQESDLYETEEDVPILNNEGYE